MRFHWISRVSLAVLMATTLSVRPALAQSSRAVVINEIAWMGTTLSTSDEWIELYNRGTEAVFRGVAMFAHVDLQRETDPGERLTDFVMKLARQPAPFFLADGLKIRRQ